MSCKVIEYNPPYLSMVKVPAVVGPQGYQTLLENSSLVSYCQVRNQYKQRVSLSIYHTFTHTQLQRINEREEVAGTRDRETTAVGRSSYYFWVLLLVRILSMRKLRGFLLYGFPEENICVYCLLCIIVVLVILSVKYPKIMLARMIKNLTWYQI